MEDLISGIELEQAETLPGALNIRLQADITVLCGCSCLGLAGPVEPLHALHQFHRPGLHDRWYKQKCLDKAALARCSYLTNVTVKWDRSSSFGLAEQRWKRVITSQSFINKFVRAEQYS